MFQGLTLLTLGHSLSLLERHEVVLITDDFLVENTNKHLPNRQQPFPSTLFSQPSNTVSDVAIEYQLPLSQVMP